MDVVSLPELGLTGFELVRVTRAGLVDVGDIILSYVAGDVPSLEGVDLPGLFPDFEASVKAHVAFMPAIKKNEDKLGGVALGAYLWLLVESGFRHVTVSPRMVYVDSSRPQLVEGFTKSTFTAMVEGVRERALAAGLIDEETWAKGIRDLYRTAAADGTFCYTFFKAVATT